MISLSAIEVERRFAILGIPNRFSDKEKQNLSPTNVVNNGDGIIGFPVPQANKGLNILNLRRMLGTDPARQPSFFDHPWYLEEPFASVDCAPGWHFLHMEVLPASLSEPVSYVRSLRLQGLELPSAAEVSLMLFLHYAGTREQLLQKKHTWCRDTATVERFVTVGAFGRNGIFVSAHPGAYFSRGLGICAKVVNG